jgi:hypothetical protein
MKDIVIPACAIAVVALLAVVVYQNYQRFHKPLLTTTYQAVTLVNGHVYYGRIDHLGTDHPVLRDAFTIDTETVPLDRQTKHLLIRRQDTLTAADHLIFPITAITSVEPVRPGSAAGRLIREAGMPQ